MSLPTDMDTAREACLFPTLNAAGEANNSEEAFITLPFCTSPGALDEFCRLNDASVSRLFQCAWSVVLQTYTGSSRPAFLYLGEDEKCHDGADEDGKGSRICSLDLSDNLSVTAALSSVEQESAAEQTTLSESLNTVVKNTPNTNTQGAEHLVWNPEPGQD